VKDITRRGFLKAVLGALGLTGAKAVLPAMGAAGPANSSQADDTRTDMASTAEFFESRQHLIDLYRSRPRSMPMQAATADEFNAYAKAARAKFGELIGLDRMTPTAANPRRTGAVDRGDHVREHWLIDTEPDVAMPFYILRPKKVKGRAAAVICCHGHGPGKDAVAGLPDRPGAGNVAEGAFGVQFAKAGLLAFCPDARGFGERREADARKDPTQSSCTFLQMVGLPLGISVIGMHAFDLVRLIDHMQARDDVRGDRIGCVGFSGGGWQSLALGAVDDRPACVVVSSYIHPVAAPLLFRKHNCACNMVPHLWEFFDLGDLAALIAPRPLLIQTGDSDSLSGPNGVADVQPQVDIARRAYQLLGCQDRIAFDVFHGGHRWDAAKALPWVGRWLTA